MASNHVTGSPAQRGRPAFFALPLGDAIAESLEPRRLLTSAPVFPLSAIPVLNSHPGAPASLYLDFNGDSTGTWGSYHPGFTPALDQDGDPTTFTQAELDTIRRAWEGVAEDYSPFNLNVTTVDPGNRTNLKTMRVVIGGNGNWFDQGASAGVSYVGSFSNADPNTAYVFLNSNAGNIAIAASHEAGHSFGLAHQSSYDASGNLLDEYAHGDGVSAPIMGYAYGARSVWWSGPTPVSAGDIQNDVAIIASSTNGFGYRPDDHVGGYASAGALPGSGTTRPAAGVIEQSTDQDWFSFTTSGTGTVTAKVAVAAHGADLDARLELRSAGGAILLAADTTALGESFSVKLAAGTYELGVMSHHYADSSAPHGYRTRIGDIGQYTLTVTLPSSAPPQQRPFKGTPFAISPTVATTIQAEDFDLGGEGIAYHDTTPGNILGVYRPFEGVDLKPTLDSGGGYRISDIAAGEWVEYTVNVQQAGTYDAAFRVSSPTAGGKFHLSVDASNASGSLAIPKTGGYGSFVTVTKTAVSLPAGQHVLRVTFDTASNTGVVGTLNWLGFSKTPVITAASQTPAAAPSTTSRLLAPSLTAPSLPRLLDEDDTSVDLA